MPDFVALAWDKHQLYGLEADVSKSRVRVRRCFRLPWPDDFDPSADTEQAGQWLRKELDGLGVHTRRVLVSLPREEVVVRQLDVPDVPDDELPDLVRLQAETKISSSLDRLVLDFLPLSRLGDAAVRPVLMVTVAREQLDAISGLIKAAELDLASLGVSSAAIAELVARVERSAGVSPDETTLTVARYDRSIEILLMRRQHLLFTHSAQLAGDDDQQNSRLALAEIRRSLGALARSDAGISIARSWVIGAEGENRFLCQMLADQLACEVDTIDPLAGQDVKAGQVEAEKDEDEENEDLYMLDEGDVASHVPYAGLQGMLLAAGQPTIEAIDFLKPRRPVVRADRRNLTIGAIAAAVVLLFAAAYGGTRWQVSRLEADISAKRADLDRVTETVKRNQPMLADAAVVNDWHDHSVNWLDRMDEVSRELNQSLSGDGIDHAIYLGNFDFTPASGTTAGHIQATGFARNRKGVERLYQRLVVRDFRVQPHEISRSSTDSSYPYRFQLDLSLTAASNRKKRSAKK